MGAQCQSCDTSKSQQEDPALQKQNISFVQQPVNTIIQKIIKSKVQVAQFYSPPSPIEARIQKITKIDLIKDLKVPKKISKVKSPFNFFFMNLNNQAEYPKDKCIIYKTKQNGQFCGYFEGVVKDTLQIDLKNCLIVFSNGSYFQGLTQNTGIYFNQNSGLRYEGGWINQMPHGLGKQKNNKGQYEGEYVYGQKSGKGKFSWNDGSYYEGNFYKGMFSGAGELKDIAQGYQYKGQFLHGQKHGIGVQKNQKELFQGVFVYGQRSGMGKLTFSNVIQQAKQSIYQGNFQRNTPNGKGKLTYYDQNHKQNYLQGIWENGRLISIL